MAAGAPDIAGLLAQMGSAGPPQAPGGPPQGGDDQVPGLLQQALDAIHRAFALETEPIDKAELAKIMTAIQNLFAQEQKEKDQAMGGTGMKLLRRNR